MVYSNKYDDNGRVDDARYDNGSGDDVCGYNDHNNNDDGMVMILMIMTVGWYNVRSY